MVHSWLNHTFDQILTLHLHTVLIKESDKNPTTSNRFEAQSIRYEAINMGRHLYMYMFCPYVISTLYCLLKELQMRTFKTYFFLCNSSHNLAKRNELRYHCCLSQLYFIGTSFLLQQKDRVVFVVQEY
jgi:hypothetical protein